MFSGEDIEASFEKIGSKVIKDLICFDVWERKGRVEGVHPDFGRLSYVGSDKISGHYHLNADERVELILQLTEKLTQM